MAKQPQPSQMSLTAGWSVQPGEIPDKLYFKIGEVCEITGVKQHALRYWESEFKIIKPQRARSKQRLYRRVDVENILKIKKLLQEEGFTLAGAKKALAKEKDEGDPEPSDQVQAAGKDFFQGLKEELQELKQLLEKPVQ